MGVTVIFGDVKLSSCGENAKKPSSRLFLENTSWKKDYLGTKKLNHISRWMRKRYCEGRHHNPVSKSSGLDPLIVLDFTLHIHSYPDSENRHGPGLATRSSDNSPVSYLPWSRTAVYQGGEAALAQTHGSWRQGSPSSQGRETWQEEAAVSGRTTNLSRADLGGKSTETALARRTRNLESWTLSGFWRFYRVQLTFKQCLTG